MATRRIKGITNTATTFASDDFIALDGTSQGTRKMDKDDLIAEVSAGVSGDYLEEANNLSDVASVPDSKGNLEVPDVGTAPNEVPLNGQLGSMAYQSSEAVSMGKAEVESTTGTATTQALTVTDGTDTLFLVREDGRLGVNTASPAKDVHITGADPTIRLQDTSAGGSAEIEALNGSLVINADLGDQVAGSYIIFKTDGNEAVRIDSSGRVGIQDANPSPADSLTVSSDNASTSLPLSTMMVRNNSNTTGSCAGIAFQARNSAADVCGAFVGAVSQSTYRTADLAIHTRYNGTYAERLRITNSALVLGSGMAIDFGSTNTRTGVTISGSTLSHYEEGSWTPTIGTVHAGPTPGASAVYSGKYVRIGQLVHCSMDLDFDASGTSVAVDDRFTVGSLPLAVNPSLDTYTGAGSLFIYLSAGAGNNAFGTVGVSTAGDSAICYITHIDGTVNWGNNLRATFTYHTDA